MIRLLIGLGGLVLSLLLGVIVLVVLLLTGGPVSGGCAASCPLNGNLVGVAIAAQTLQQHIFGLRANQYNMQDPVIQQVLPYWEASCGSGGHLCSEAQSGNLQCVEFVSGAFFLGGDPLPGVANAEDLWSLYQQKTDWSEIPATAYPPSLRGLPAPGDMMIWKGGGHLEAGQYVEYGHVAIVIAVSAPQGTQDGFVTVAQGNAPGNRWDLAHASDPGNWYTMPLLPDLSVPTWGSFTDGEGIYYDGYTVLGYIRQHPPQGTALAESPLRESREGASSSTEGTPRKDTLAPGYSTEPLGRPDEERHPTLPEHRRINCWPLPEAKHQKVEPASLSKDLQSSPEELHAITHLAHRQFLPVARTQIIRQPLRGRR